MRFLIVQGVKFGLNICLQKKLGGTPTARGTIMHSTHTLRPQQGGVSSRYPVDNSAKNSNAT